MSSFTYARMALFATALTLVAAIPATAQPAVLEVTLVALDAPAQRSAVVYRRAQGSDRDVIALSPSATSADLAQALRTLQILTANADQSPAGNFMAVVRSERARPAPGRDAGPDHSRPDEYLRALRAASRRKVPGFGTVRSIRVAIAPAIS